MSLSDTGYRDRAAAQNLGARIDARVRELKLKHSTVAQRSGINYKTYMNYISGTHTPDPFTLQAIATVLTTTTEALTSNESAWYSDDPRSAKALHDIRNSALDLTSDELEMLAELALCVRTRRLERNFNLRHQDAALELQARIHERLLPVILREQVPVEIMTCFSPTIYSPNWMQISVQYRPDADLEQAQAALVELIKIGSPFPRSV